MSHRHTKNQRSRLFLCCAVIAMTLLSYQLFATAKTPKIQSSSTVTTVTFWEYSGHAAALLKTLINEFNQTIGKKKGVHVALENHGRHFQHDLQLAMDQGNPPDIFPSREALVQSFVRDENIIPISSLPGGKRFINRFSKEDLANGMHIFNDEVYAIPTKRFLFKLIYNKTLFKQANLVDAKGEPTPPKTWEEFRLYAKKISDIDPGKTYGLILPMKGSSHGEYSFFWEYKIIRPFSSSFGKLYFDSSAARYNFTTYKPLLEMLKAMKEDGSIFPGEKAISDDAARIRFGRKGNVGMYFGASWDVGVLNEQYPAKIDWGVADMPLMDPKKKFKTIVIPDYGYTISKTAAQKDLNKVMAVFEYIHSDYWLIRHYEEAKFHPIEARVYRKAMTPPQKGWVGFTDPNNVVSVPYPNNVIKIKGPVWYQVFQMIYDDRLPIDEALDRLNSTYNQALQAAIDKGTVNIENYTRKSIRFKGVPK